MDYKSYFAIPEDITYLNTPGNGLLPTSHLDWRAERDQVFFASNGDLRDQQPAFIKSVKDALASLFQAKNENVYAVPNFSFGLHTVLSGLPIDAKMLLIEGDYPSLNYPALSRGFSFHYVKMDENVENHIYQAIQIHKINVLMLSLVQYISGLKIDLSFIQQLKQEFPDLIIIGDATQFLGTEPFDFSSSGFDVIGGSGYKWLLAGFGNGYLMLSDQIKALLFQVAQHGDRPKEEMWAHKSILDTFFEPGHQDTLAHGTLLQSIHFFEKIGLSAIQKHLNHVSDYAYERFEERGWLLPTIAHRSVRSSLINVQVDTVLYPYLMANGIKCFHRGTGIRIGIHLYNSKADIDKFIETVENFR